MNIASFSFRFLEALADFVEARSDWGSEGRTLGRQVVVQGVAQPGLDPVNNCWVIEHLGRVHGFCLVNREPSIGRAVLQMEVDPVFAGSPQERELVEMALESCRTWKANLAHLCLPSDSPRAILLQSMGFSPVHTYSVMAWREAPLPVAETAPGFHVTAFREGDEALLTRVQNDAFNGSWGFYPNTVDQIKYRTNMANTSHDGILFLRRGDKTAGHCWTCVVPSSTGIKGRIAMIGIVPEFRGLGLSKYLLSAGMSYLGSAGVRDIALEVYSNNTPAVRLYTSLGFVEVARLSWFELTLA